MNFMTEQDSFCCVVAASGCILAKDCQQERLGGHDFTSKVEPLKEYIAQKSNTCILCPLPSDFCRSEADP